MKHRVNTDLDAISNDQFFKILDKLVAGSKIVAGHRLWLGAKNDRGHGRMRGPNGIESVHRISWKLFNGDIPKGHQVRHTCPHKACWTVDHLELYAV